MNVLGSIDNASYKSPEGKKAVCHIIITPQELIIAKVLDRHKEIQMHRVNGSDFGGGARGFNSQRDNLPIIMKYCCKL